LWVVRFFFLLWVTMGCELFGFAILGRIRCPGALIVEIPQKPRMGKFP